MLDSFSGDSVVTYALPIPNSSIFLRSAFALVALMSLLIRTPSPLRSAPICVLLPPGAAHRSSTLSPGFVPRSDAGVIAEGS